MSDVAALKKQVEFYFSDSNYRKDTFLKAAAETDPEGFIPIAVLLTFNKMKTMKADVPKIVEAIQDSDIVHLNEDNSKIKKASPLPEEDDSKARTIYAKGYPTDDSDITIDFISQEFSKFGKVNLVKFRRDDAKAFKGSCFIEFSTEAEALNALAECNKDGKVSISYKDNNLLCVMRLGEWLQRREDKRKAKKAKIQAEKAEKNNSKNYNKNNTNDVKTEEDTDDNELPKSLPQPTYVPGLVIKIENLKDNLTYDEIKTKFNQHVLIRYVAYTTGETIAYIRLSDPENLASITKAIESNVFIDFQATPESKLIYTILSGEDEIKYYQDLSVNVNNKRERGSSGGRGGGRGRGGRGGGRGFKGSKRGRRN